MCDVCDAALFNYHWACSKCGFVVCLHCYRGRKNKKVRMWGELEKDRDRFSWLLCTTRQQHDQEKLLLVQIVAGDALEEVAGRLDDYHKALTTNNVNGIKKEEEKNGSVNHKTKGLAVDLKIENTEKKDLLPELKYYTPPSDYFWRHGKASLRKIYNLNETKLLYPKVSHSWLDDGRVLRFSGCADEKGALDLFRDVWSRGQPVVMTKAADRLDLKLWSPRHFAKAHGNVCVDYADLLEPDHPEVTSEPLADFWEGFLDPEKRLKPELFEEEKLKAVLKVTNWPPRGEQFAEYLSEHSRDLLKHLPLPEYTRKSSVDNLASYLPDPFVRADLGPRVLLTQGLGRQSPGRCSVRLSCEVADAMWLLVNVCPGDQTPDELFALLKRLLTTNATLDEEMRRRIVDDKEVLGCLWQVFHPADADKLRDFLNADSGCKDNGFDALHEAKSFLTPKKLKALEDQYGVRPYNIVQFLGEGIMIPAGAPRQVTGPCACSCVMVCMIFSREKAHSRLP